MKYCTKCGGRNDDDARFCNHCGREMKPVPEIPPPYRGRTTAIWLGIALVILVAGGAATFLHLRQSDFRFSAASRNQPADAVTGSEADRSAEKPDLKGQVEEGRKKVSEVADEVFGSDQGLQPLPEEPPFLPRALTDVDYATDYAYTIQECNNLFSDIFQQAGYRIQQQLSDVMDMPADAEEKIWKECRKAVEEDLKGKLDRNLGWLRYVRSLGQQLTRRVRRKDVPYHFHVVEDEKVNAFCIPGGGIYVNTGLLKKVRSEAELISVLAHEISHEDLGHTMALFQVLMRLPGPLNNPVTEVLGTMMRHPYSARAEADADRKGLELMYGFGYSPYRCVKLMETMKDDPDGGGIFSAGTDRSGNAGSLLSQATEELGNVLRTHPAEDKRICLVKNHIVRLQEAYPREILYVGRWNLENRTPMFRDWR